MKQATSLHPAGAMLLASPEACAALAVILDEKEDKGKDGAMDRFRSLHTSIEKSIMFGQDGQLMPFTPFSFKPPPGSVLTRW